MYREAARFSTMRSTAQEDATRSPKLNSLIREIQLRNPGARTLLDVACGTGANFPRFSESFEVMGLDASRECSQ